MKCPVCAEQVPFGTEICPHCKAHIVLPEPMETLPARPARCLKRSYMISQIRACSRENIFGPIGGAALSLGLTTLVVLLFMLYRGGFFIPAILAFGIPALVFIMLLILNILYYFKPFYHPLWKKVASLGKPQEACRMIEEEINSAVSLGGENRLTQHCIFARTAGRFEVLLVSDLIWVTLRRFHIENDEAPPTDGNDVILVDYRKHRNVLRFNSPDAAQDCVAKIKEHCPWLIFGSSAQTRRYVRQHASTLHRQITIKRHEYQMEADIKNPVKDKV